MFLHKTLCEQTLQAILQEKIELVDLKAEYKNDLHSAALNSVYFDIKTQDVNGRIITLDLQRKYVKDRIRNRIVYYACREIASQEVIKSKYENLKNVIVSFVLTEASMKTTSDNTVVSLVNTKTGERYSDLLTIHEVNIRHINENHSLEMQILKSFFEIESELDFLNFKAKYIETELGKLLLEQYKQATQDTSLLENLSEEGKFVNKLSDEERLEERLEGKQEGLTEGMEKGLEKGLKIGKLETANNMLKKGFSIEDITEITGLSKEEIQKIS